MSFEQQFEKPPVPSQEKAGEQMEQKEARKEGPVHPKLRKRLDFFEKIIEKL